MRYNPFVLAYLVLELLVALYSSSSKVEFAKYFSNFSFLGLEWGGRSLTLRTKILQAFFA